MAAKKKYTHLRGLGNCTIDDAVRPLVKVLRDKLGNQRSGGRRQLRRLYHDRITRSDSSGLVRPVRQKCSINAKESVRVVQ